MPYEGEWSMTIHGKGKIYPLDNDSIDELFVNILSILISAGQDVNLYSADIRKSKVELIP